MLGVGGRADVGAKAVAGSGGVGADSAQACAIATGDAVNERSEISTLTTTPMLNSALGMVTIVSASTSATLSSTVDRDAVSQRAGDLLATLTAHITTVLAATPDVSCMTTRHDGTTTWVVVRT